MIILISIVILVLFAAVINAKTKIANNKQLALLLMILVCITSIGSYGIYRISVHDTEILNGFVMDKRREKISCSHSYDCNCRTRERCSGSGKDRSCTSTTECDTCYRHSHDFQYRVETSIDKDLIIDTIDEQGKEVPPRFSNVKIGEPIAYEHSYINYVKASKHSLFHFSDSDAKYQKILPEYPEVFDYYRLHRFLFYHVSINNFEIWNKQLSEINADLGKKKQVNTIVILTSESIDFYYALRSKWFGGKKNDVILVIGTDQNLKPQWVETMTWSKTEDFVVHLRHDIMDLESIKPENTLPILKNNIELYYQRKPMADFHYLAASITPTFLQWLILMLINIIAIVLFFVIVKKNYNSYGAYNYYKRKNRYRF